MLEIGENLKTLIEYVIFSVFAVTVLYMTVYQKNK